MFRIEFLKLNLGAVIFRYYLLMMIVIAAGFLAMPALGLIALPVFLSAILGVSIKFGGEKEETQIKKLTKAEKLNAA